MQNITKRPSGQKTLQSYDYDLFRAKKPTESAIQSCKQQNLMRLTQTPLKIVMGNICDKDLIGC